MKRNKNYKLSCLGSLVTWETKIFHRRNAYIYRVQMGLTPVECMWRLGRLISILEAQSFGHKQDVELPSVHFLMQNKFLGHDASGIAQALHEFVVQGDDVLSVIVSARPSTYLLIG